MSSEPETIQRPERSTYTSLDFLSFRDSSSLSLTPKFQRRKVWGRPARAFFIDTLLRGLPVPPIYLRVTQSKDRRRTIREVVDGQQRISAVLDYLDGKFALTRSLNPSYAGLHFDELSPENQDAIRDYGFICEIMHGISDSQILEIFSRLNTYSVPLNAQELRNGTYFGFFKQSAYKLAHQYLEFWRRYRIFGENAIARMLEVELTSELMILQLDGLQDKKGSISDFYAEFDESFPARRTVEQQFRSILESISEHLGDVVSESAFRRSPLFYSLYGVVYHRRYGMPGLRLATPRKPLARKDAEQLRDALQRLSEVLELARGEEPVPHKYNTFVLASFRQTDNLQPRMTRLRTIYREAFG